LFQERIRIMRIIGAVGKNGSGKDEVLKHIKTAFGIPFYSTGDLVREMAAREGIEPTRENLGAISRRCFNDMGEGCFVRLLADKIRDEKLPAVGISGVRSLADVTVLKSVFGGDCVLINVEVSDSRRRFERMVARGEERDPDSFEQFLEQEQREEELFHIEEAQDMADFTILNNGTLADLHEAIDHLVREKNLLGFIP
jgi:dephospho-CoA kinase